MKGYDVVEALKKQIKNANLSDMDKAGIVCWLSYAEDLPLDDRMKDYLMALIHLEWRGKIKACSRISKFNQDRINKWKELTKLWHEADDNTRCPVCKEQFIACGCVVEMAQDIMESVFYRKVVLKK